MVIGARTIRLFVALTILSTSTQCFKNDQHTSISQATDSGCVFLEQKEWNPTVNRIEDSSEKASDHSNSRILTTAESSARVDVLLKACMWSGIIILLLGMLFDRLGGVETIQLLQTFFFAVSMTRDLAPLAYAGLGSFSFINGYNRLFTSQSPTVVDFGSTPSLSQAIMLM